MSVSLILKEGEYPPLLSRLKGIELNRPSSIYRNLNNLNVLTTFHYQSINITFNYIISGVSVTVAASIQVIGKIGIITVPTFTMPAAPSGVNDFINSNIFFNDETAPYGYPSNTDASGAISLASVSSIPNTVTTILRVGASPVYSYIHIEAITGAWTSVNPVTVYGFSIIYPL